MRVISFICLFFILFQPLQAQQADRHIDTIRTALKKNSNDTQKATLLLELALVYIHKPGSEKTDLDSAVQLIKSAEALNNRVLHSKFIQAQTYFAYSNSYREGGHNDTGQIYINKSIEIFKQLPVADNLGYAYIEASQYVPVSNYDQVAQKIYFFTQAADVYAKTRNATQESYAWKNIADFKHMFGRNAESVNDLKKALSLCPGSNKGLQAGIYDLLDFIYFDIGDYSRAVQTGLMAAKISESVGDTSLQMATIYYRLGGSYAGWRKFTEALFYIQKAFDIASKYKSIAYMDVILPTLCTRLNTMGRWQDALTAIRKFEANLPEPTDIISSRIYATYIYTYRQANMPREIEKYVQKLQAITANYHGETDHRIWYAFYSLTEYYFTARQYLKARFYSDQMLASSKKFIASRTEIFLKTRASIDSALGDCQSALANYQAYKAMSDSLYDLSKSIQVTEMEVEFSTAKTQNDLKLNQQKLITISTLNKLQAEDFKKASLIRNIIISVALLVIVLFYLGYRFKQRSNNRLREQQKEINHQNNQLKALIEQKEWLLKEVHHRVKNNLQIVVSLLSTQSRFLDNKEAIEAIADSRHRMHAMSLIHQKLYQSENTASVNMQTYIAELVEYLSTSFDDRKIKFHTNVQPIELDLSQAIPIGLILNEVISNAIKYAFTNTEAGFINVTMFKNGDNVDLSINDNGVGLPAGFNWQTSTSMGLRLINGLAKQINAVLTVDNENGVGVHLVFKNDIMLSQINKGITNFA